MYQYVWFNIVNFFLFSGDMGVGKSCLLHQFTEKKCKFLITALLIRCKPATGRQIFADLDRFLGRHAVLSDSVGWHKHFFSLQIQQTSSTCNKKKVSVF